VSEAALRPAASYADFVHAAIYPVETLKTRLMSSQSSSTPSSAPRLVGNALVRATARDMWNAGGIRTYYRGLTAGLIGVFPYSAIDMSTFEGIKLFYIRYTGKEEPGVLALLAFGSVSGSVGATTVYPLKCVLQTVWRCDEADRLVSQPRPHAVASSRHASTSTDVRMPRRFHSRRAWR
jgi:hypothetical protein